MCKLRFRNFWYEKLLFPNGRKLCRTICSMKQKSIKKRFVILTIVSETALDKPSQLMICLTGNVTFQSILFHLTFCYQSQSNQIEDETKVFINLITGVMSFVANILTNEKYTSCIAHWKFMIKLIIQFFVWSNGYLVTDKLLHSLRQMYINV